MDGREFLATLDKSVRDRLETYVQLLGQWRKVTNLISDDGFEQVWRRHILDAIHLQRQRPEARVWLDIGSGAGLPGVVIACLLAGDPEARVHCVEIDRRKCAFLREVASKLALPLKVHNRLAEQMTDAAAPRIDAVTARAFSSLDRILQIAEPQMKKGAVAVLPRGRSAEEEVARLDGALYTVSVTPNPEPGDGVFVQIRLRDATAS